MSSCACVNRALLNCSQHPAHRCINFQTGSARDENLAWRCHLSISGLLGHWNVCIYGGFYPPWFHHLGGIQLYQHPFNTTFHIIHIMNGGCWQRHVCCWKPVTLQSDRVTWQLSGQQGQPASGPRHQRYTDYMAGRPGHKVRGLRHRLCMLYHHISDSHPITLTPVIYRQRHKVMNSLLEFPEPQVLLLHHVLGDQVLYPLLCSPLWPLALIMYSRLFLLSHLWKFWAMSQQIDVISLYDWLIYCTIFVKPTCNIIVHILYLFISVKGTEHLSQLARLGVSISWAQKVMALGY